VCYLSEAAAIASDNPDLLAHREEEELSVRGPGQTLVVYLSFDSTQDSHPTGVRIYQGELLRLEWVENRQQVIPGRTGELRDARSPERSNDAGRHGNRLEGFLGTTARILPAERNRIVVQQPLRLCPAELIPHGDLVSPCSIRVSDPEVAVPEESELTAVCGPTR
jgi:hypothetical protein